MFTFWKLYVLELLRCVQLHFVTLRHVTFTLFCFMLCSNIGNGGSCSYEVDDEAGVSCDEGAECQVLHQPPCRQQGEARREGKKDHHSLEHKNIKIFDEHQEKPKQLPVPTHLQIGGQIWAGRFFARTGNTITIEANHFLKNIKTWILR